jgi:hypothetical protein
VVKARFILIPARPSVCSCFVQLKAFYEARRDDLWYGYKLPLQPSELRDDDVPKTPSDEDHHAYKWNAKHPEHAFGAEHEGHGKKH